MRLVDLVQDDIKIHKRNSVTQPRLTRTFSGTHLNLEEDSKNIRMSERYSEMFNKLIESSVPVTPIATTHGTTTHTSHGNTSNPTSSNPTSHSHSHHIETAIRPSMTQEDGTRYFAKNYATYKSQVHDNQDHLILLRVLGEDINKFFLTLNLSSVPLMSIALDQGRPVVFKIHQNQESGKHGNRRLRQLTGDEAITADQLLSILNNSNVGQYDHGLYYINRTLHTIRVLMSPFGIPTAMTFMYQEHQDLENILHSVLYQAIS